MKKGYEFREMTAADDAAVASLVRDNLKKHGLDIPGTAYYDEGLDHLSRLYGKKEARYFVLEDGTGRVAGGIGFAPLSFMSGTAELQKLYLDDAVKGAGLGYEMVSFIEERIREAGYSRVYLETHSNLQAAIHIYEKSGYRQIERPEGVVHSTMDLFFIKELTKE